MAWRILSYALLFLTTRAAMAEDIPDADLPPIDPPGSPFRMMTLDDDATTSRCVGNPVTPLCAAETEMACHLRGKAQLCIIARPERRDNPRFQEDWDVSGLADTKGYRIIAALKFTEKLVPPTRHGEWFPGDVGITTEFSYCRDGICPPPHYTGYQSYVLHLDGGRWRVIHHDSNRIDFTRWPPPNVKWDE